MGNFFVCIYNILAKRKALLYLSLIACIGMMSYFAFQLKFEENITRFFPDSENGDRLNDVFSNLRIKDKIVVLFSTIDEEEPIDEEDMIASATLLHDSLLHKVGDGYISNIVLRIDANVKNDVQDFVYNNLPLFLSDSDYLRMDSLLVEGKIESIMQKNYSNLLSPAGAVLKDYVMRDPLGLGGNTLKRLQDFQIDSGVEQNDGYLFAADGNTLLMFITPLHGMGSTGENDKLVTAIEEEIAAIVQQHPNVRIEYYGGPSVGVYNARQIKQDSVLTIIIALTIIIIFTSLAFKEKRTIPLIISPVLFGGLFSLFMIYLIKGSISAIAVGSGSIILGVALSYSIHMIVHQRHVSSVQQLIKELTYPLTVGSFTTIGAFLGLLFTSSDLLRDFGLFAAMSLIGTTLFCLIYLPHFLKGEVHEKKGRLLRWIEKFNAYKFHDNRWLVGAIIVIAIICAFTSQWVGFDANMQNMSYEPKHIKDAENRLMSIVENNRKTILFVSIGKDSDEAIRNYQKTNKKLNELQAQGLIQDFASADYFLIPTDEQDNRLDKWTAFWTVEKKKQITKTLQDEGAKFRFKADAFSQFYTWLDQDFEQQKELYRKNSLESNKLLGEWQNSVSDMTMLMSQVQISENNKAEVYQHFTNTSEVVIFDRGYLTNKWVSAINDDFYLILGISSLLIFCTLLLSYGRIELAFISFLPMFLSWIIIVGVMGILGMQFNIITIILSTFIFGIGDDFSIFIMDGLQNKYRTGKSVLNSHKTAIFFSAFTVVVGMGSLVFAQHPALQSISAMSILGMLVVVLVSYTIPPVIFRILIASPVAKGLPPYTLGSLLMTALLFILFVVGCLSLRLVTLLLILVPISKNKKRQFVCRLIMYTTRFLCWMAFIIKKKKVNISKSTFNKPSIVIANHQSFLDILYLLSLHPRMVMVTNEWVWKSPVFGAVIRYAGYLYTGEGWENSALSIKERLDAGYSVIVFPEGTRTYDGIIKRFHKGAFYFADAYKVDITPVVLYGMGMIIAKAQPFYVRKGTIVANALPRITSNDLSYGEGYKERTKRISSYFKQEYTELCVEYTNPKMNPYFYNMLVKSYLYKGPVEEWYVRIKVRMEKSYQLFHSLIPTQATVTNIGCGYGTLDYMLMMLAPRRKILGIDYDEDKIEVAQHGYLHNDRIDFVYADAMEYDLPESDVFVMHDVLHYMNKESQQRLIEKCANLLSSTGMIIIRDGNTENVKKQKLTYLTELFSTRILGFNKVREELCFMSAQQIETIAQACNLQVESFDNDKYTSNTVFILKKKESNEQI